MSRSAFLLGAVGLTLSSGLSAATVSEIRTVDTSGQPGEVVELHVVASFSDPAYAFSLGLNWDPERLSLLGWMGVR